MLRKPVVLLTGASGEIGHGLIERLAADGQRGIITLDLRPLDAELARLVQYQYLGSILDSALLERILAEFEVDLVFHLAALLSTRGEFTPASAHSVNVEGTLRMLEFAQKEGESHGRPVLFLYPSSIAAYGLPDLAAKNGAGRLRGAFPPRPGAGGTSGAPRADGPGDRRPAADQDQRIRRHGDREGGRGRRDPVRDLRSDAKGRRGADAARSRPAEPRMRRSPSSRRAPATARRPRPGDCRARSGTRPWPF